MNTNLTQIILGQAPEVCEQMIRWHFRANVIGAAICLMLALLCFIGAWWFNNKFKDDCSAPTEFAWGMAILLAAGFFIGVICGTTEAIQIHTAPKAWLVEHIMQRAK